MNQNIIFIFIFFTLPVFAGTPISENELFKVKADAGNSCAALIKRNESICGDEVDCSDAQQQYVQPNENYEVALRQVFINQFADFGFGSIKKGEIAVVANVAPIETQTLVRFDRTAWKNARVVYYSPKVGEKNFLSTDNLLVFGPTSYQEQSLLVQFYLLELDEQNKGQQQLISQLAELGKAYVSAPAPVVNVLSSLAKSLIVQNRDDLEIKYETRLSAPLRDSAGLIFPASEQGLALQFGYYVVAQKRRNNSKEFPNQTYFNYKDARVYSDADCKTEFNSHNYLVFEVKRNPQATPVGNFEVFDKLMERLGTESDSQSKSISEVLQKAANEQALDDTYSSAIKALNSIERYRWRNVTKKTQRSKAEASPLSPTLQAQLITNLNLLKNSIKKQKDNQTPDKEAPFSLKQSEYLLTRIIQIAGDESEPWTLYDDKLTDKIIDFFKS